MDLWRRRRGSRQVSGSNEGLARRGHGLVLLTVTAVLALRLASSFYLAWSPVLVSILLGVPARTWRGERCLA
jgi:hypothetical protein